MKYVRPTEETNIVYADTLEELIEMHKHIGFVGHNQYINRFMIVTSGEMKGLAVVSNFTRTSIKNQRLEPMSQYRVFDTAEELYEWMKGKEDIDF